MSTNRRIEKEPISVAMATYNGAEFIEKQLTSVMTQSRPPNQIVIADDHSQDATMSIIDNVVSHARSTDGHRAPEIRVDRLLAQHTHGVGPNFYRALQVCVGDFIAFADQDDLWHVDKLDRLTKALREQPMALVAFSNARLIDAAGDPLGTSLFQTIGLSRDEAQLMQTSRAIDVLFRRNVVTGATMLFRRELVMQAGPIPPGWIHDEWLAFVAAWQGQLTQTGFVIVTDELIDYRQHGGNVIGASPVTAKTRVSRLTSSRNERNARLLQRAESMVTWTEKHRHENPSAADKALHKLAHEKVRSALPGHRLLRIVPVLREWFTGRYGRFGRGIQDVVRDLVQPI